MPASERVVEVVGDRHRLPVPTPVRVPDPRLELDRRFRVLDDVRPRLNDGGAVVDVTVDQLAGEIFSAVPGQAFIGRTDVLATAVDAQDHDAVGRVLHERTEPRLGGRDTGLGLTTFADVVHVDDDAPG